MGLFELGKRIFGKQLEAATKAPAGSRVDTDLPMGAQVGGLIEIPRSAFAILDGSLLRLPDAAQMPITAVSRVRIDADPELPLFRFYTACGVDRKGDGESFLQVLGQGEDIRDIAYYQFLCRIVPTSAEEQAAYQGNGYGLGDRDYWMAADLLQTSGLSEDAIAALLAGEDALHFVRDTPGGDYVPPFSGRETRIDDGQGETGLTQRVWFMLYARTLPDGNTERLLISFEVHESFDGQRQTLVKVDFMVGLTLDRQKVKVL